MSRPVRKESVSGYVHAIVRGIGRQLLFEEAQDYQYFIWLLKKYCNETGVTVCAYCLMDNHVHLLLFDKMNGFSLLMKKLGISYSAYFNRKYDRTGHLFQDRYKSEPIENESYLLSAFRYILKNPEKAGVCSAFDYPWSSCSLYGNSSSFVDTTILQGLLGDFEHYREFITCGENEPGFEGDPAETRRMQAEKILLDTLGTTNGLLLQSIDYKKRDAAVIKLHKAGLSIRAIERLTGISKGIIERILW